MKNSVILVLALLAYHGLGDRVPPLPREYAIAIVGVAVINVIQESQ